LAVGLFDPAECDILQSHTAPALAAFRLETEDMPPLLWLQSKLYGLEDTLDIKHVVIDEAQDCSLFQLAALKALTVNASFTILGDLHQGIYAYKSVEDWEAVRQHVFARQSGYMTLEQSYRTTVEIMEAANAVISRHAQKAWPYAKPVIRHGPPVLTVQADNLADCACKIDKQIMDFLDKGYRSVAVIAKTLAECEALKKRLKSKPKLINGQEQQYEGGLLLAPVYLVKGLEFDAVIIADQNAYQMQRGLDVRLLYVAMTRALHELTVLVIG
jgi:DNA helicase-2/ATP-dependent DNA helicase PcrA